ncbi:hypothetical protein [Sphingobacterium sp. IITKGP-BTPF85]|nr:hypothetical protein [Sphingobacterium sp. IITKGP-BTPF85]KKX51166.1 hypothetical protein L950_0206545 [Sphingobacterium sp. IITKGP-BTPF85]
MAVGKQIVSVFCGAADKEAYEQGAFVSETKTIVHQQNEVEKSKNKLYKVIRDRRTGQEPDVSLSEIYQNITHNYPEDWLAYIETLELAIHDGDHLLATQIENRLLEIIQDHQHWSKLILDGINLAKNDQIALLLGPK